MTSPALPATMRRSPTTVPWTVALLMPIGPAAIALLRFVLPYYTASTSGAMATSAAAHQSRQSAVLWLGYVAALTLVPGVLALGHLTRAASPRLTTWGSSSARSASPPAPASTPTGRSTSDWLWKRRTSRCCRGSWRLPRPQRR